MLCLKRHQKKNITGPGLPSGAPGAVVLLILKRNSVRGTVQQSQLHCKLVQTVECPVKAVWWIDHKELALAFGGGEGVLDHDFAREVQVF